jgi:seryl-tRNA synthetase
MHNIKDIRKNFDEFVNSIKKRNQDLKLENILELDKKNRNLIKNKEILEK